MSMTPIRSALKSQYHATLTTLQESIERCPESLWTNQDYKNSFWRIAYHTLFFAHLYLMQKQEDFVPWKKHRPEIQNMDEIPEATPYTKEEILEYGQFCIDLINPALDTLDLEHPESGYPWYQMPKLEHQIVNIRHIQHHTGQLVDRLRNSEDLSSKWVRKGENLGFG